jgi:cell division protein DivIC
MSFRIVNLYHQKQDYTQKEAALNEQIEEELSRQEELEKYEKYVQTDEYVEKVAQSKLGLVYDNEIVFKEKTEKN